MKFNLGKNLKMLRLESGFSVCNICLLLSEKYSYPICNKTYYKWESGEIKPTKKSLQYLADIFHTTISGILTANSVSQVLTDEESDFIDELRTNIHFRRIVSLLTIVNKEELKYANKLLK